MSLTSRGLRGVERRNMIASHRTDMSERPGYGADGDGLGKKKYKAPTVTTGGETPAENRVLPRKLTAIGVSGDRGASFTVYEKNWQCADCGGENYARRTRCWRCRSPKPEGGGGLVTDEALQKNMAGEASAWKETVDPESGHIYYYNKDTHETSWERPAEMGAAPMATGWFGRGAAGSQAAQHYEKNNLDYLKRPARKQKEHIEARQGGYQEGADEYNIWYHRHIGEHWRYDRGREAAESRCIMETDAGFTKADSTSKSYFCIHFCRGFCAMGHKCTFHHRIPTIKDDAQQDMLHDCFGRERHASHKDDMGGVGNFMEDSRTLYIGGLRVSMYKDAQEQEEVLWRHFGEWGELENINVIHRLSICFVRYRLRSNAEFAKEAMSNQALEHEEVLNIRWAHDDPNPVAQQSRKRADQDAIMAIMEAKGISTKEVGFQYPDNYQVPDAKRQRIEGPSLQSVQSFPDTDAQYHAGANVGTTDAAAFQNSQQYSQYASSTGAAGEAAQAQIAAAAPAAPANNAAAANASALDMVLGRIDSSS